MRVVVVGAGSVGRSIARELLSHGHDVVVVDATAAWGDTGPEGQTVRVVKRVVADVAGAVRLTLRPGDLVATGTPDGVGMGTGEFLNAGDIVTAAVEKVGTITNPIRGARIE